MRKAFLSTVLLLAVTCIRSQDTSIVHEGKVIQLTELVIRSNINVPAFMKRLKDDTSFYKSFKNLRILNFTAVNDVRMLGKRDKSRATLYSTTRNRVKEGCRTTEVVRESTTGDFYDTDGGYNYYTAAMYASLFFAKGKVCGETNIVKGSGMQVQSKSGMDKHREQLKMLFFNPGVKIPGIPVMGNKLALFDKETARNYDFTIDLVQYQGEPAYVFSAVVKPDLGFFGKNRVVIDEMTTWFALSDFAILGRTYHMTYNAGLYDFDVNMEVQMSRFGKLVVPVLLRYNGDWDVPFKKRERGVFTATLSGFSY